MPSTGLADPRGFRSTDYTSYPKVCVLSTYRRVLWEGPTALSTSSCGFKVSLMVVGYLFGGT